MEILALFVSLVWPAAVPDAAQTILPKAATIATAKGDFQVPGRAFLDGSQPESRPPVIELLVPLLQGATSTHVVCQVDHATEVELTEVQRDVAKKRYVFRVRAPKCSGWVPETALSVKKVPTMGGGGRR